MNPRSLVLVALALLAGIVIGVSLEGGILEDGSTRLRGSPGLRSDEADSTAGPAASAPTRARADVPVSEPVANPTSQGEDDPYDASEREAPGPRHPSRVDQADEVVEAVQAQEAQEAQEAREESAAEDFARFGDGPVSTPSRESYAGAMAAAERPGSSIPEAEVEAGIEAESCAADSSPCRRDSDCCGAAVCRARPGAISGHFACRPG